MPQSERNAIAGLPAPAAGLLPHRRPVRLIDTLQAVDDRGGRAGVSIPGNPLFIDPDGRLNPTAHLELIAQTFAAVKGWRERQHDAPPQTGYLVGADAVSFSGTARIGDRVSVTMQESDHIGAFVVVRGQVHRRDRCLARGRLKLWLVPPDEKPAPAPGSEAPATSTPPAPWDQAMASAALCPLEWENDHTIVRSFCFPQPFIAFQGHFPGNPVLPAFAQVRVVLAMLASAWRNPVVLERLDKAKFREPLRPGQSVQVLCRLEQESETYRATASLTAADRPLSSFQATVRQTTPT